MEHCPKLLLFWPSISVLLVPCPLLIKQYSSSPCSPLPGFPNLYCLILLLPFGCARKSRTAWLCKCSEIDGCVCGCSFLPANRNILGLSQRHCFTAVCSVSSPRTQICIYVLAAGSCDRQQHKGCLSYTSHVEVISGINFNAPDVGCREHSNVIRKDDIFITFQHQLFE